MPFDPPRSPNRKAPPLDREVEVAVRAAWAERRIADARFSPTLTPDGIETARELASEREATEYGSALETFGTAYEISDVVLPRTDGRGRIPALVARPRLGRVEKAPLVYWVHGGGMVVGGRRGGLATALGLSASVGAVMVSVEYRLAPEFKSPVPVEDCYEGLLSVVAAGDDLGLPSDRLIVAGVSAGGGLAAGVALLARDRGGPSLLAQMLLCPMLDDRELRPSSVMLGDGEAPWDRTSNRTGWTALLGPDVGGPSVSSYSAPSRAESLSGLPPSFLEVGSVDTFRDEVVDYATRIWLARGSAELHVWPGGCHDFTRVAPRAQLSRIATETRHAWLARLCR